MNHANGFGKTRRHYIIEFAPKRYDQYLGQQRHLAILELIADHIVAEVQTNRYGKHPPVHDDEIAYTDGIPQYVAFVECQNESIRQIVRALKNELGSEFEIHYHVAKPKR